MTNSERCESTFDAAKKPAKDDDSHNYKVKCIVCGQKPTVANTRLCGPCCFGEAETAGGNW
jgi:ribosomal protein L37E